MSQASTSISPGLLPQALPHEAESFRNRKIEPSNYQPLLIALTILGLAASCTACVGIASLGAHQALWPVGMLSHLNQIDTLILISSGVGSSFVFLIVGMVCSFNSQIQSQKIVQHQTDDIESFQSTLSLEKQKVDRLNRDNTQLTTQLEEEQTCKATLLAQLQPKNDEISRINLAKQTLETEKESLLKQIAELEASISKLNLESGQLKTQLEEEQTCKATLLTQLQPKNDEISRINLAKQTLETEKESQLAELEASIRKLNLECEQLKIQLEKKQGQQTTLRSQFQEKNDSLQTLIQAKQTLETEKESLLKQIAELEASIGKLNLESGQLKTQLEEEQTCKATLLAQLQPKNDEISRINLAKQALETEKESLLLQLTEHRQSSSRLSSERDQLSGELEKMRAYQREQHAQLKAPVGELSKLSTHSSTLMEPNPEAPQGRVLQPIAPRANIPENKSPFKSAWDVFTYDQIAEQKYQVVLNTYRHHLSSDELVRIKDKIDEMIKQKNPMLEPLQKMLACLMATDDQTPRVHYQNLIRDLRAVIESPSYQKISGSSGAELAPDNLMIRSFIRRFCLIRWKEISLYNYLKQIVHLTIQEDRLTDLNLKTFPQTILDVNQLVKKSTCNKKSMLALEAQKLTGAMGLEDFCGNKNTPHLRNTQYFTDQNGEMLPISYIRHGTPTALGSNYYTAGIVSRQLVGPLFRLSGYEIDSGEEVTSDYKEYLRALEERGESELFCVYQRRSQNVVENERTRAIKIDGLQEMHPNIFVLTQPVEGDLFEHKGPYAQMTTFEELKKGLEQEFFDTNPAEVYTRAVLPAHLRRDKTTKEGYRAVFKSLLEDVHSLFFPSEKQAMDLSMSTSLQHIEDELAQAYRKQTEAIQEQIQKVTLNQLEHIEQTSAHEQLLQNLLEDKKLQATLSEKIKTQIQTVEQLEKWAAVDRTKTITVLLQEQQLVNQVIRAVIISVVENALASGNPVQKLEDQKAEFLSKWQSYILLFYAFQKIDLKTRLNGVNNFKMAAYKTPCKDFLDRGGNQAFVEDRLIDYMLGIETNLKRMEETLYNLLGPPILVKKKEAITSRIIPGMNVEKLLASMPPEARKRLSSYTFGDRKWRVTSQRVPKEKGQSAAPLLSQTLRREITQIASSTGEETELLVNIPQCFAKYAGINLKQWTEWTLPVHENPDNTLFLQRLSFKDHAPPQFENEMTLEARLLKHPVIQEDQAKLTHMLSFFQQASQTPATSPLISMIGNEIFNRLFTLHESDKSVYELDLCHEDRIVMRFSVMHTLTAQHNTEVLRQFPTSVRVICRTGPDSKLHVKAYVNWTIA